MNAAELAVELAEVLKRAGIPHAIGGAIAYGFWGNPRGTRDVDLNVFVAAEEAAATIDVLAAFGLRIDHSVALASVHERGDARGYYD